MKVNNLVQRVATRRDWKIERLHQADGEASPSLLIVRSCLMTPLGGCKHYDHTRYVVV
jgi:hypothetical protein